MSVILKIIDLPAMSQGQTGYQIEAKLQNSGSENATDVRFKAIDSVVYAQLKIETITGAENCLNVYNINPMKNRDDGTGNFPAGTEKRIRFGNMFIKSDAPVGVNDISTMFKYTVY